MRILPEHAAVFGAVLLMLAAAFTDRNTVPSGVFFLIVGAALAVRRKRSEF